MTELAVVPAPRKTEIRVVQDPIPVLDTGRFEHMQRIASVMAHSSLVPDALCKVKVEGEKLPVPLEPQEIVSNCFLVVNQAVRWGMDPFAVAQCVSVVHGKLCYEGKLIAAVLDAKLGIELEYEITGEGDKMKVVVSGAIDGQPVRDSKGKPKTVEGTVADWKTAGNNSPWSARGGSQRMLRYRGAREWARVHSPAIMLGVYSDDEMEVMHDERRGRNATEVIVREDPPAPPPPPALPAATPAEAATAPPAPPPAEGEIIPPADPEPAPEAKPEAPPAPPEGDGIPPLLDRRKQQAAAVKPVSDTPPDWSKSLQAFLEWSDVVLGKVADPDFLERTFNEKVNPHTKGMFPPDEEELLALYTKHERRLGIG
jgi:hypothetical protein